MQFQGGVDAVHAQEAALSAHSVLDSGARGAISSLGSAPSDDVRSAVAGLRGVVRDSWMRSLALLGTPSNARARNLDAFESLSEARLRSPLQHVLPVLDRLLIDAARDTGLIVAITNEQGRLLWVRGDRATLIRAEGMDFVEGADWSEAAVGTSAPGTALASGLGVQISGAEHFAPSVHPLSCTAVPIRDPGTGLLVGAVDLTGDERAVGPHSLSLMRAAVAAAEAEMRVALLEARVAPSRPRSRPPIEPAARPPRVTSLGRGGGRIAVGAQSLDLSPRHSEILVLLASKPDGLSSGELALRLYGESAKQVTLRAEIARLRVLLKRVGISLAARPYRLEPGIESDVEVVLEALGRGAVRRALSLYPGELLPASDAPGISALRAELSATLREQVLSAGSEDAVLAYLALPEAVDDVEGHRTALSILAPRSPRRARIVAQLEALEAQQA